MLRRRSKTRKREPRAATGYSPQGTRRRARPDTAVPPELRVKPEVARSTLQPPSSRARERIAPAAPSQGGSRVPHGEVVLVTGFEPFDGESTNPSWDVCAQLPAEIAGIRIETCRVPCEFRRSIEVVAEAIERHHPVLVLCLGQAGGRTCLGVERVAINVDDARIPDNAGQRPVDEMIAANGPPAYFATLPVKAIVTAVRAAGVPVEVSNSAGTYVCNHLMYGVLHYLAASGHRARAGFMHVPYSEQQVLDKRSTPSMAIASMVKGVHAAIGAALQYRHDIKVSEGALS
jgi:pyroglutamyl-peptidase